MPLKQTKWLSHYLENPFLGFDFISLVLLNARIISAVCKLTLPSSIQVPTMQYSLFLNVKMTSSMWAEYLGVFTHRRSGM